MLVSDVAVVGAGPAGATAAMGAARAGLSVVLVDRATFPRDKCCGDGLTTAALRRLEALGLDPWTLPSWQPVRTAHVRIPDGRQAALELPNNGALFAATVRRVELDAALVNLAREAGAEVHEGRGVTRARSGPGHRSVDIELDDGEIVRSRYVIGADGMWSPLRKALGESEPGYLGEWHAVRQYFRGVDTASRDLWVWFERDLRPGYMWSFPLPDGVANAGFGVRRIPGQSTGHIKALWADLLRRPHIAEVLGPDARPEGPIKTWPIPARIGRTRLVALEGRVLFVGDAARASDCLTGEGISQALETAALAARTIAVSGPDAPASAATMYRAAIARGLALDDLVSRVSSRALATDRGAMAWFDVATRNAWTRQHFTRWMFEDRPRAVALTPWRWRWGLRHPPGAYHSPVSESLVS